MRRTLADLKASRIPAALGMCADDTRLLGIVNEAQERLLASGAWYGTYARYRVEATEGRLVWPKEIASILSVAVCKYPIKSRNSFFEFVEFGTGVLDDQNTTLQLVPRNNSPLNKAEIVGTDSNVIVYCDLLEDEGATVLLLGYDENGNWIRTLQGATYADGEIVAATQAGASSTKFFSSITGVQKPATNGSVRLYGHDTVLLVDTALAVYAHDETNPDYRVSYISELDLVASSTNTYTVDVLAKMAFAPVVNDTDYLVIQCIPALKDMCVAVWLAENEATFERKAAAIAQGLTLAKQSLDAELRHFNGATQDVVQVQGCAGPTGEILENVI